MILSSLYKLIFYFVKYIIIEPKNFIMPAYLHHISNFWKGAKHNLTSYCVNYIYICST